MATVTPTLTVRDAFIQRETMLIEVDMILASLNTDFKHAPINGFSSVILPDDVIRAHAKEVATRAYDAAQERATLDKLNNLWASE